MTTPSRTTNATTPTTTVQNGRHSPDIAFDERRTAAVRWAMWEFEACLGDHAWEGGHDLCCEDPPTDAVIRCYTLAGEEDLPLGTMTRWALYDMHTDLESAVRGTDRFRLEFRLEDGGPLARVWYDELRVRFPEDGPARVEDREGTVYAVEGETVELWGGWVPEPAERCDLGRDGSDRWHSGIRRGCRVTSGRYRVRSRVVGSACDPLRKGSRLGGRECCQIVWAVWVRPGCRREPFGDQPDAQRSTSSVRSNSSAREELRVACDGTPRQPPTPSAQRNQERTSGDGGSVSVVRL